MPRSPRTLVFDLDGALSDPEVGIGRSINYALAAYGYDTIPDSAVSQYIGPQIDQSLRVITGEQADGAIGRLVAKDQQLSMLLATQAIDLGAMRIGDRAVDIQAARSNGLASVGVLWGHGSREELTSAGAGKLLRSVEELRTLSGNAAWSFAQADPPGCEQAFNG